MLFLLCSLEKSLRFGQKFKMHLELVKKTPKMEIGFTSWLFLGYCWIGAFSILFILIKSQYFSWKTDASCRSHCQVHIPGFHQVILMDVLNPSHHWVLWFGLIKPPNSIPQVRGDGGAFPCFHWVSVWKENLRAVAKLHPCDLSSIVWVSWGKPGYWLINLFAATMVCGARAGTAGRGYLGAGRQGVAEGDFYCPAKGWKVEIFPLCSQVSHACCKSSKSSAVPCAAWEWGRDTGLPKPAFSLGTIQPLWKKTLGTKNKAWSFKSRLPELLRKTSKWCH